MTHSTLSTTRRSPRPGSRTAAQHRPATRPMPARRCDASGRAARAGLAAAGRGVPAASTHRSGQPQPALRLTRRGRVLLVLLAAVLLLVVFSLGRASSGASSSSAARVARRAVVVQRGETLWQVARRIAPDTDPRITVERIIELNGLDRAGLVRPGQQIVLPG